MSRKSPHTPEQKAHALGLLRGGMRLPEVQKLTGIPRPTLSRWARAAGIESVHDGKTAKAVDARRLSYAETIAELEDTLGNIARTGAKAVLDRLRSLYGPNGEIDLSAAKDEDLAKLVGAFTRSIHDLQLISGRATSRVDTGSEVDRSIERLIAEFERNGSNTEAHASQG